MVHDDHWQFNINIEIILICKPSRSSLVPLIRLFLYYYLKIGHYILCKFFLFVSFLSVKCVIFKVVHKFIADVCTTDSQHSTRPCYAIVSQYHILSNIRPIPNVPHDHMLGHRIQPCYSIVSQYHILCHIPCQTIVSQDHMLGHIPCYPIVSQDHILGHIPCQPILSQDHMLGHRIQPC